MRKVDGCGSISSTYLDPWTNESSRRNLVENPANFAGCRLLYITLHQCLESVCYCLGYRSAVWWNPLSLYQLLIKDSKSQLTFWLILHSPHLKTRVIPSTDLLICRHFGTNEKPIVLKCACDPSFEKAAETIWRVVNTVEMCWNTFYFFDYLVILRHNFTRDGKVSCLITTISDWFPIITI